MHYRDFDSEPKVNVYVQRIDAVARNLTNAEDLGGSLVATFEARALAMHSASKGRFRGYVKPFIDDLQILDWEKESEGFFTRVWEGVVEVAAEVLEDQSKDRIATRIPLSGKVNGPEADVWSTVGGLLKNAFLEALRRGLENEINLSDATASKE